MFVSYGSSKSVHVYVDAHRHKKTQKTIKFCVSFDITALQSDFISYNLITVILSAKPFKCKVQKIMSQNALAFGKSAI